MAARPKSGVTADTDVNLDFLTKEEKEALLSKKMDIIRQRNKALTERHKLIEADKKKAEEAGQAVKPAIDSQTLPAEGAPPKARGRGRGQNHYRDANRPGKERPKSQGDIRDTRDIRDSSQYEPIVDTAELSNYRSKGRGGPQDRDAPNHTPKNRRKPPSKEEAATYPSSFEYEPIVDMKDLDKRFGPFLNTPDVSDHVSAFMSGAFRHSIWDDDILIGNHSGQRHSNRRHDDERHDGGYSRNNRNQTQQRNERNSNTLDNPDRPGKEKAYSGRLKDDDGPPPDPSFNPLADRRRSDKKEEPVDHRRHPRNYGGGSDLNKVKQSMKNMREKERERPPATNKPLELVMTGKERKNHEEWKAERERYDQERIQRQMNDSGTWRRAWDADKVNQESDESYHSSRHEPAKRPAGRIGSGRFDRGEREERPRSAVIGKGGTPHQDHPPQPQRQHHHPDQQPHSPAGVGEKAPRGRGRGRGRGRAKPNVPGEKSPRPRTWSGGDDRFVECSKELLLVKFDNTAGDNSVEVEYDDADLPSSPQSTPKSPGSSTTPGRGPTGRTPNQGSRQQPRGNKQQKNRGPRNKGKHSPSASQESTEEMWDTTVVTDNSSDAVAGFNTEETRVRTSSHSQSYGDSEEWEDCTESSGVPEEDVHGEGGAADLVLSCKLNPEAPEFLPTSPDFLKTPPGHVKVLNWAADNSPTSPLSQGSVTSPPQLSQGSSPRPLPTTQSPVSSPGSSASAKVMRKREEADMVPDADQPHPPPFLLAGGSDPPMARSAPDKQRKGDLLDSAGEEDDDDDDKDQFEDSIDEAPHEDSADQADEEKSSESIKISQSEGEDLGKQSHVSDNTLKTAKPLSETATDAVSQSPQRQTEVPASSSKTGDESSTAFAAETPQASKDFKEDAVADPATEHTLTSSSTGHVATLSDEIDSAECTVENENPSKGQVANDSETQIANDSKSEITNDGESQVANDSKSEITNDGESQVANDSKSEITNDGESQVVNDSKSEITNDGESQVANDSKSEITNDGESQVVNDSKSEITNDGESQVVNDSKSEITNDGESQVGAEEEVTEAKPPGNDDNVKATNIEGSVLPEEVAKPVQIPIESETSEHLKDSNKDALNGHDKKDQDSSPASDPAGAQDSPSKEEPASPTAVISVSS